jgi:hypothetical protein
MFSSISAVNMAKVFVLEAEQNRKKCVMREEIK